jgi:hypothetical protein
VRSNDQQQASVSNHQRMTRDGGKRFGASAERRLVSEANGGNNQGRGKRFGASAERRLVSEANGGDTVQAMTLRDVVGTTAKMSAGFWNEVARLAVPERPARSVSEPNADPSRSKQVEQEPTQSADASPAASADTAEPAGVLVPIDTWTRVMDQLGNLHEAGQQLAEARERAARAETQVEFLRDQLAASRTDKKPDRRGRAQATTVSGVQPASVEEPTRVELDLPSTSRSRVTNARARVANWIRSD